MNRNSCTAALDSGRRFSIPSYGMPVTGLGTAIIRIRRGAYITPEDYAFLGKTPTPPDETVERWRRAHRNDLESILPFLIVAFLYALSGPSFGIAATLLVTFTAARILHTVTYVTGLQPWRTIFFEVGQTSFTLTAVLLLVNLF
jgi:uncharacterized MAPEG superfamily protein